MPLGRVLARDLSDLVGESARLEFDGGDAAVPDCEVGLGATCPPVADDTAVGPAVRVAM